ncbi:MAG: insulinase family protein [Deltaproteobacteria bacterium]|nr:insulinase family protein [Deltaproteobacteria bacterium]
MVSKTILDNNIRVVSEEIGHVRSISIGAWVEGGSRRENPLTSGTAHFIEHMLFKGTERRSAFDIASAIDSVGGVMNAATGKELTSFYIKIPDYRLEMAVDLLADIFTGSRFAEEEIGRERSVILQEIRMVEDSPDDHIHDFFEGMFWKGHPLGLPILGTKERVESFRRDDLFRFFQNHYGGSNLVLTAAGNLRQGRFAELVRKSFGSLAGTSLCGPAEVPVSVPGRAVLPKELEQAHLIVGAPAPSAVSPERHAAFLLNAVLGGSMSSRLFQEIREKRGLAYDIGSYLAPYRDAGLFGVCAGTDSVRVREVLGLIREGLERSCAELLTEKELRSAKELLKGNFLLGMESTDNRMSALAKNEIYFGRQVTLEEIIERIDAVGREEIRELAGRMFRPEALTVAALGPVSEEDLMF